MPTRLLAPILVFLALIPAVAQDREAERPRNVILFVADGLGPSGHTLARAFKDPLAMDAILVGTVATASANAPVTDSAASATALACGVNTNNGMVAVAPDGERLPTLIEAAEDAGMVTGLIATSRITHATPACFSAHVKSRGEESEIAHQQLGVGIDVILGGGWRFFRPVEKNGIREDGRDLLEEARRDGYHLIDTRADLLGDLQTPVLGLFTADHMAYEIDRPDTEPSLAEMTRRAIELLRDHEQGFLLVVEGSRIDHAAHNNDVVGFLHDVLAYDAAIAEALRFARRDKRTLVVATADHETGGLALSADDPDRPGYGWDPSPLRRGRCSHVALARALEDQDPVAAAREHLGVTDLDRAERQALAQAQAKAEIGTMVRLLNQALDRRARVGWTTRGHSGVDVNLYAFGPGRHRLVGHRKLPEVGAEIGRARGLKLSPRAKVGH
jgi:alkaline phosphatase